MWATASLPAVPMPRWSRVSEPAQQPERHIGQTDWVGSPITPPAMIGVIGGDVMARYFVAAARVIGYRTTVLDPDSECPAAPVADVHLVADYDDPRALAALVASCAVVTTTVADPPTAALARLDPGVLLRPSLGVLIVCHDRPASRQFLTGIGAPVRDEATEIVAPGTRRLSMVVARTADGRTAAHPVIENLYVDGVLDQSFSPADVGATGHTAAERLCTSIAAHLDLVGILTVQMCVVGTRVLVEELVPRPHPCGNLTIDACESSQFEQLLRAVCGLGLGSPRLAVRSAASANLYEALWAGGMPHWGRVLDDPNAHLHLYGEPRGSSDPHRRAAAVGHLTVTSATAKVATFTAERLRALATKAEPQ